MKKQEQSAKVGAVNDEMVLRMKLENYMNFNPVDLDMATNTIVKRKISHTHHQQVNLDSRLE